MSFIGGGLQYMCEAYQPLLAESNSVLHKAKISLSHSYESLRMEKLLGSLAVFRPQELYN